MNFRERKTSKEYLKQTINENKAKIMLLIKRKRQRKDFFRPAWTSTFLGVKFWHVHVLEILENYTWTNTRILFNQVSVAADPILLFLPNRQIASLSYVLQQFANKPPKISKVICCFTIFGTAANFSWHFCIN